jgi:hypothetical protein
LDPNRLVGAFGRKYRQGYGPQFHRIEFDELIMQMSHILMKLSLHLEKRGHSTMRRDRLLREPVTASVQSPNFAPKKAKRGPKN